MSEFAEIFQVVKGGVKKFVDRTKRIARMRASLIEVPPAK